MASVNMMMVTMMKPWFDRRDENFAQLQKVMLSFGVQPFSTPYDKAQVNTITLVFNSFIHSDL